MSKGNGKFQRKMKLKGRSDYENHAEKDVLYAELLLSDFYRQFLKIAGNARRKGGADHEEAE